MRRSSTGRWVWYCHACVDARIVQESSDLPWTYGNLDIVTVWSTWLFVRPFTRCCTGVFGEVGEVLWHSAYSMVDQAKTSRFTTVHCGHKHASTGFKIVNICILLRVEVPMSL
jgi:hypothetical protein